MPKSVQGVMHEFKDGELHSGSSTGKVVTNRKQAVAIALSEQRQRGATLPHPHRNLGAFLHAKKRVTTPTRSLADNITSLRSRGAFSTPRGATGY